MNKHINVCGNAVVAHRNNINVLFVRATMFKSSALNRPDRIGLRRLCVFTDEKAAAGALVLHRR